MVIAKFGTHTCTWHGSSTVNNLSRLSAFFDYCSCGYISLSANFEGALSMEQHTEHAVALDCVLPSSKLMKE